MKEPTIKEAIDHLCLHYGMSLTDVLALVRTPFDPRGLRDEFAGQALGGMLASVRYDGNNAANVDAGNFAKGAYAMADAMLAERAK